MVVHRVSINGRAVSGDRIKTTGVPGMATSDTFYSEPTAFYHAVAVQRFKGVIGTPRMKSATATKQRADQELIHANQKNEGGHGLHCDTPVGKRDSSRSMSSRKTELSHEP